MRLLPDIPCPERLLMAHWPCRLSSLSSPLIIYLKSTPSTGYADCSLYSTASAVCVESFGGTDANFPGISTETYTGTDLPYMPIVITAGPGSSLTSSVSATPTGSLSSTPTPISSTRASSTRRSSSGGAQATPGTSISTGGVPAVTGHAGWIVGGAAVAVAMAM